MIILMKQKQTKTNKNKQKQTKTNKNIFCITCLFKIQNTSAQRVPVLFSRPSFFHFPTLSRFPTFSSFPTLLRLSAFLRFHVIMPFPRGFRVSRISLTSFILLLYFPLPDGIIPIRPPTRLPTRIRLIRLIPIM